MKSLWTWFPACFYEEWAGINAHKHPIQRNNPMTDNKTPRVLISDKMSPLAEAKFKERGIEVDYKPGMSKEELIACIGDYNGLAIRSATRPMPMSWPPPKTSKSLAAPALALTMLT